MVIPSQLIFGNAFERITHSYGRLVVLTNACQFIVVEVFGCKMLLTSQIIAQSSGFKFSHEIIIITSFL